MVVLATDIDMGSAAISRAYILGAVTTTVDKNNPANASGKITSVQIYASSPLTACKVAIFHVVSGNNLSARDIQLIGNVAAGSTQTFEVDLNVEEGDYIGAYWTSGNIDRDVFGVGYWYVSGDKIPCTDTTFSFNATKTMSLYGTGTTEEEEEANVIFFGTNF